MKKERNLMLINSEDIKEDYHKKDWVIIEELLWEFQEVYMIL